MEDLTLSVAMQKLPKIEWNYEELKEKLSALLTSVKVDTDVLPDEITYKVAKSKRADARKMLDAMEIQRKAIEKEYLQEWNAFKEQYNELKAMVNAFIDEADGYAKAYEAQLQEEKKAEIERIYQESFGEYTADVPLEKIWKKSWLNKTTTLKEVEFDIHGKARDVREAVTSLKKLNSKYESELLCIYFDTLSLPTALARKAKLEEMEERKKQAGEKEARSQAITEEIKAEQRIVTLYVNVNDFQLSGLLEYCKSQDIEVFDNDFKRIY